MTSLFSDSDIFTFGDVFEFDDLLYVYLAPSAEGAYCARVFTKKESDCLERLCQRDFQKNEKIDRPMLCYVILTTQELEERAAHFGKPEFNHPVLNKRSIKLDYKDLEALKKSYSV